MSSTRQSRGDSDDRLRSLNEVEIIVDTDAHVLESLDLLLPYIDDRYGGAKQILDSISCPRHELVSDSRPMPYTTPGEVRYRDRIREGDEVREGGADPNDPEARIILNEKYGIDYSIVNPGALVLGLATVTNDQLAVAVANGYNNWLMDTFLDEGDKSLKGTIQVAAQRPDIAAEEIDRLGDEGAMVGVQMLASGHIPPLSDRRYDPIYEAAQSKGLPVMFHSGTPAISHGFPLQHRWHETYIEDKVIGHPFSHMWNLTKMLCQGLPVRFPNLDFVYQEAGITWIPYLKWRLDDYYFQFADQVPMLKKLPSKYVEDQFYFSTQPLGHTGDNPGHMAKAVEIAGPESLLYSSDIPHHDFDPPEELFDRVKGSFEPDVVQGMMGETAAELFQLA